MATSCNRGGMSASIARGRWLATQIVEARSLLRDLPALLSASVRLRTHRRNRFASSRLGPATRTAREVPRSQAYPAHLQALLKQKGVDAVVTDAGIDGDTTGGHAGALGQCGAGRNPGRDPSAGAYDKRRGQEGQRAGNIAKIRGQLVARGVKLIVMENDAFRAVPQSERAADGVHFTPRGYAILAQNILPQVLAAVGK